MDEPVASKRSEIMAKVRHRDTDPELVVQRVLAEFGIQFVTHVRDLPGTPDIALPAQHLVIQVNGCFWHGHNCRRGKLPATNRAFWARKVERNQARDRRTARRLRALGWSVHTLWECRFSRPDSLRRRIRRIAARSD